MLLLGLDAPADALADSIARAAACDQVRGFAVGRTIFGEAARAWLAGEIADAEAKAQMQGRFGQLINCWQEARRAQAA